MFLTNLLISCMFALAPVNNVQPVQDQQYNEVVERKNLVGVPNDAVTMFSSDFSGNEFFVCFLESFLDYNSDTPLLSPTSNFDTRVYLHASDSKAYGYISTINSNDGTFRSYDEGILIYGFEISKTYNGIYGGQNGPLYVFDYNFYFLNQDNVRVLRYAFRLMTYRSIYYPPFIGLGTRDMFSVIQNIPEWNAFWVQGFYREDSTFPSTTFSSDRPFSKVYLPHYFEKFVNTNDTYTNGYNDGFNYGYTEGYVSGQDNPNQTTYDSIYNQGKQEGDAEGYQRALDQNSTAATIFSGIVTVGLLPVNVMLSMFEYEVFGINIAGLVSGLFTIAIVIIIIRLVTGKKND